jgi:hypothetical protein
VNENAPFSVSGKVNPLAGELIVDIAVAVTNTDLTAFTPYMEKYAGYPLNKGKFSMAVHYDVKKNVLKAENAFMIDLLTLGQRVENDTATKLPVKLAIALLKDRHGRIDLDVPLSGRIDDPQFKIGPIIGKVIVNILIKAATSPFALLGAAFGGGEELSFVEFEPGRAALPEAEAKKLDTLAKALYERPSLNLEIAGAIDRVADRHALARTKLEQQFKVELAKSGAAAPTAGTSQIDPAEYERFISKLFLQMAATNQALLAPPDATETNAPPVRTGQRPIRSAAPGKGAEQLAAIGERAGGVAAGTASGSRAAAKAIAEGELTPSMMETRLAGVIPVGEGELRELLSQRARTVESYLLKTEKVSAERLFIAAPKPTGSLTNGNSRVNLSLN